ncbi:hypothetical protein PGB90_009506 [Kerria lacca]
MGKRSDPYKNKLKISLNKKKAIEKRQATFTKQRFSLELAKMNGHILQTMNLKMTSHFHH